MNILPKNFVVNVNPPSAAHASLNGLLDGIELEDLMQFKYYALLCSCK